MSATEISGGLVQGRGQATRRAADAMLRVLGATEATFRLADPSTGDTGSQLGLTPPTSADVQVSPALVESILPDADGRQRIQVTVSAKALQPIADAYGVEDITTWLLTSEGIVHHDKLMKPVTIRVDHFAGMEYLYHIVASE